MKNRWSMRDSSSFVDVGVVAGLALHIRAGRGFFIVDARAGTGFIDQDNSEQSALTIRNIWASGFVSYCFNPKKKKTLW